MSFYKLVAERGVWDDDLLRDAEIAWMADSNQGKEVAMLKWWIAAERGFEIAQSNLGYILDQGEHLSRPIRSGAEPSPRHEHSSSHPFLPYHGFQ